MKHDVNRGAICHSVLFYRAMLYAERGITTASRKSVRP